MKNLDFLAYEWSPFGYDDIVERTEGGLFQKTDLTIATTAAWRAIMGKLSWWFTNYRNPAFGAIRKVPWTKSGARMETGEPATAACQGIAESGNLPTAQVPNLALHATQFKQVVTRFRETRKMKRAAELGDDSLSIDDLRTWAVKHNALEIDKMILENAEATAAGSAGAYSGKHTFEALDRIISCDEEEDDLGGSGSGMYDPWTLYESTAGGTVWDRDSGTTYDAVVVHADGTVTTGSVSALGTDATFNLEAVDVLIDTTQKAGADKRFQFFVTGYDTARRMSQLISAKQRFVDYQHITVTVNGIQSVEGARGGFRVATYDDIPIIRDPNVPKDGISRLFLLDSRSLYFKVATPTFLMSPAEAESYAAVGKLIQDHWLLTEGELWCTDPTVQGKLRSAS